MKSGKTSGIAINVANTGQLLSLLDAAAPGPGGKIVIQATAASGNSRVNISGKVQADGGTVDIRHSGSSGQVNLTNADLRADTLKVADLGNNGVLQIGGGSPVTSASTETRPRASRATASRLTTGSWSPSTAPRPAFNVNSQNNIPKANYSGFGGNGHTTGTFGGSGANNPQPLGNAPALGLPPGG